MLLASYIDILSAPFNTKLGPKIYFKYQNISWQISSIFHISFSDLKVSLNKSEFPFKKLDNKLLKKTSKDTFVTKFLSGITHHHKPTELDDFLGRYKGINLKSYKVFLPHIWYFCGRKKTRHQNLKWQLKRTEEEDKETNVKRISSLYNLFKFASGSKNGVG